LGEVKNEKMILNDYGQIVLKYWQEIPRHYDDIELDEFQIMPNHHHGIIIIKTEPVGAEYVGVKMTNGAGTVGTEYYSVPTDPDSCNRSAPFDILQPQKQYGLLSKIIKSFKHVVVKEIRCQYNDYNFQWQRSFHDRVIRNEQELIDKRYYIQQNPTQWPSDRNNPINIK